MAVLLSFLQGRVSSKGNRLNIDTFHVINLLCPTQPCWPAPRESEENFGSYPVRNAMESQHDSCSGSGYVRGAVPRGNPDLFVADQADCKSR